MANYSLVINSRFKPFTYQELLAPAMQMTQAHQAVEEAYADLQTKASIWDKMANETTDPKAHAAYKKYADDLESYAYNLSKYGLNTTSRKDMFDMRARYAKEIVPIETAFKKREEQAKEQRVALMNNPTLLLSRRAAQTSLDDYLANPNLDYEVYSGAMLTQQVAQQAQAIAKELREAKIAGKLDAYHNLFTQKYGFYPEEVLKAIQNPNDPNNNKILGQMVDSAIASSGIANWADQKTLDQARAFAVQGLWSGIGQTQVAPMNNFGTQKALEHSYAVDTQRRAQAFQASENAKTRAHQTAMQRERIRAAQRAAQTVSGNQQVNHMNITPVPLRDQNEISEHNSKIEGFIKDKLIGRRPTGELYITDLGWERLRNPKGFSYKTNPLYKNATSKYISDPFYTFMNGNGINASKIKKAYDDTFVQGLKERGFSNNPSTVLNLASNKKFREAYTKGYNKGVVNNINRRLNTYNRSMQSDNYDTYHTTEYSTKVNPTYGKTVLHNAIVNAPKEGLEVVSFGKDQNGNRRFNKVENISGAALDKGAYITDIRTYIGKDGKAVNTGLVYQPEKEPIRIKLPEGLNVTAEANIGSFGAMYNDLNEVMRVGKKPETTRNRDGSISFVKDKNGNIKYTNSSLTPADLYSFNNQMNYSGDQFSYNVYNLVVPSKTEDYKVSVGGGSNDVESLIQGLLSDDTDDSDFFNQ